MLTAVKRRAWLLGSVAALVAARPRVSGAATPVSSVLTQLDLTLEGDPRLAKRCLVLVPTAHTEHRRVLVLLHGLGETGNEFRGIHAWGERYGLVRAYERLRKPPVVPETKLGYLTQARTGEINQELQRNPFDGLVLVCPVTPNPYHGNATRILDRYAAWLKEVLLPGVEQRVGLKAPYALGLDGCSLGGYVGLEVVLRCPELFQSFGVVQAAIGAQQAPRYARRLAAAIASVGPLPVHIETSSLDPYRKACRLLSDELLRIGVPNRFRIAKGPHDQPWLREVGTLEMLLWHERQLSQTLPRARGAP